MAKQTVGTLNIILSASAKGFTAVMQSAQKRISGFGASVRGMASIAKTAFIGLTATATAAAGGLIVLTKNAMRNIDATSKLADRLGLATEDLTSLQHAADLAGVSTEQLDKALSMFVRNIGEARAGTTQAVAAFEAVKISTQQLDLISTIESLLATSDALAGISKASDRARIATDLFGRGGGQMINMLGEGRNVLLAAAQDARTLGLTFSRDMASGVINANDALTRARSAVLGLANIIAIDLSPTIKRAADAFVDWAVRFRQSGLLGSFDMINGKINDLIATLLAFRVVWDSIFGVLHGIVASSAKAGEFAVGAIEPFVLPRIREFLALPRLREFYRNFAAEEFELAGERLRGRGNGSMPAPAHVAAMADRQRVTPAQRDSSQTDLLREILRTLREGARNTAVNL